MNIPPFLERLLLSNEAVFKNASLGISGQNMVYVPPGKTAVLLEFSVEPFINNISNTISKILAEGSDTDTKYKPQFIELIKRRCYQLQIINDTYSTYFSFQDCFNISGNHVGGSTDVTGFVNLEFKGKREELFIYTDRSIYFNFLYPNKIPEEGVENPGIQIYYKAPADADGFLAKIQNLPKSPITFNNNVNVNFVQYCQINSPNLDGYYPVNHQLKNSIDEKPQMEYLRFFQGSKETTILQPVDDASSFEFYNLFQIPLLNVKYALINKRASDYGITAPTK
jgi:hypothetical protein